MSIVFVLLILIMIIVSLLNPASKTQEQKIIIEKSMFRLTPGFIAGSVIIMGVLTALYTIFW